MEFNYSNLIKWLYDKIVLFIIGLCFEYVAQLQVIGEKIYLRKNMNFRTCCLQKKWTKSCLIIKRGLHFLQILQATEVNKVIKATVSVILN